MGYVTGRSFPAPKSIRTPRLVDRGSVSFSSECATALSNPARQYGLRTTDGRTASNQPQACSARDSTTLASYHELAHGWTVVVRPVPVYVHVYHGNGMDCSWVRGSAGNQAHVIKSPTSSKYYS